MMIYYPTDCEAGPQRYCSPCPVSEQGRVRHLGLVSTNWVFTDITSPSDWNAGIFQDQIFIIPNVRGVCSSDIVTAGRFGDLPDRILYRNYKVAVTDPNFVLNDDFQNWLNKHKNLRVAYVTENYLQISERQVSIQTKDPIEETVESERYYQMEMNWWQIKLPKQYLKPEGIFTCRTIDNQYILGEDGEYIFSEDGGGLLQE